MICNAPCSGIYSAQIDGLESKLNPANIESLTVDDLDGIDKKAQTSPEAINVGDAAYKLIDNFEWYIAVVLDDKDADNLTEQSYVTLTVSEAPSTDIKGHGVSYIKD